MCSKHLTYQAVCLLATLFLCAKASATGYDVNCTATLNSKPLALTHNDNFERNNPGKTALDAEVKTATVDSAINIEMDNQDKPDFTVIVRDLKSGSQFAVDATVNSKGVMKVAAVLNGKDVLIAKCQGN